MSVGDSCLVYVSSKSTWQPPEDWRHNRSFKLAVAAYDAPPTCQDADYLFYGDLEKFRGAKEYMGNFLLDFRAVAFLDDDIEVTAEELALLFNLGLRGSYFVWQPALSADSYYSWKNTVLDPRYANEPGGGAAPAEFIEVMCPFFSRQGLGQVLPLFDLNYGGWGLDVIWSEMWPQAKKAILHGLPVGHHRPIRSCDRKMPNGLTKIQELAELLDARGLRTYWDRFRLSASCR